MNSFNNNGYATLLTLIIIGILSMTIFGVMNIHRLNHKVIRSNESSVKAYYLGESGIILLKKEVDTAFETFMEEYILMLESLEIATVQGDDDNNFDQKNIEGFKDFALRQDEIMQLQRVQRKENVFELYTEPHGWRLETVFEEDRILLYATGHYRKARKRIISIITYPDVRKVKKTGDENEYHYLPSEILFYYQGYEGDEIE